MERRRLLQGLPLLFQIKNPFFFTLAPNVVELANEFAETYRVWVTLKQQELNNPGTVNMGAVHQWGEVKKAFHTLDLQVRNS
jgi:hypothetical protein